MAERLLTINIRDYLVNQPRRKRAMRVSTYIKGRVAHYANVRLDNVRISKELNSLIIKRHVKSMKPLKVSINMEKEKAMVTAFGEKRVQATTSTSKKEEKKATDATTEQKEAKPKTAEPKKSEPKKQEARGGAGAATPQGK